MVSIIRQRAAANDEAANMPGRTRNGSSDNRVFVARPAGSSFQWWARYLKGGVAQLREFGVLVGNGTARTCRAATGRLHRWWGIHCA
jgi:hypothetical protein